MFDIKMSAPECSERRVVKMYDPQEMSARPRLLLAYADSAYAARVARSFRRLGWEVHLAPSAAEARRLVEVHGPQVMLIELDLPDESGWSACADITSAHPEVRAVLLATTRPENCHERFGASGAAALVTRAEGMESLVQAAYCHMLAKAV
jgi:DNA-binding response OmpR family regulator